MIDTGDERNVASYLISGTVFSTTFAGSLNYNKYRKYEITKQQMIQDTVKLGIQGGIGTASAVATANYIGRGEYLNAFVAMGLGAIGIYGAEKVSEAIEDKTQKKETKLEKWLKNDRKEALENARKIDE